MINLILLCFGTAGLTKFLDMCLEEGMIFHNYYKKIEKLPMWLFKPLGGCSYCFGTWIFICTYSIYSAVSESLPSGQFCYFALCVILGIGINHVFIKAIDRL